MPINHIAVRKKILLSHLLKNIYGKLISYVQSFPLISTF